MNCWLIILGRQFRFLLGPFPRNVLIRPILQNISSGSIFESEWYLAQICNLESFLNNFCKTEAVVGRWSVKKVFWKHAANLEKNSHAEVWFQFATLLKSHFSVGFLLKICRKFSEHLLLRTGLLLEQFKYIHFQSVF